MIIIKEIKIKEEEDIRTIIIDYDNDKVLLIGKARDFQGHHKS